MSEDTHTTSQELPACHFTYSRSTSSNLMQGDVISKTSGLKRLLEEVHPHYLQDDYTHFLVITQSCDLVKRGGKDCKSRYITLAAVRPLTLVLEREIRTLQDDFMFAANVCTMKGSIGFFVGRVLISPERRV